MTTINNNRPATTPPRPQSPPTTQQTQQAPRSPSATPAQQAPAATSAQQNRHTFEVNHQRGLLTDRTTISSSHTQGDSSSSRSAEFVNGRLRSSSSTSSSQEGNLSQSTQIDRNYNRQGDLSRERVTQNVTTRYGDHTTIGRTNVQDGRFSSESVNFTNQSGNTTRSTTVTNSSGPQTTRTNQGMQYRGGEYLNTGAYATNRYTDGRFQSTHGVDHNFQQRAHSTQTTITRDSRAAERGTPEDKARLEQRQQSISRREGIQRGLDIAGDLGLKTTVLGGGQPTTRTLAGNDPVRQTSADGRTTTETLLGPRVSTTQYGEVAVGADGITARGNADIRAGLYAQGSVTHQTDAGTLSGSAGAKLEAYAQANGQAALNLNGLEARGYAGVGVEASAEVSGSYRTPPVTIGGEPITAGVSAQGRVAAEAKAEASGRVQFTGNPPTAVLEGQAGASAVVKAEGEARIDAGPFSVRAQGYVSAGAEAQANGAIGYDDGKLTLSFGAGAALGVGAGGRVQVSVDVGQIGRAATGLAREGLEAAGRAADVTGDNRFDMQDVRHIGNTVATEAREVVRDVGNTIADGARVVGEGAQVVGNAVADGARAVGNAVASGAQAVGHAVSDGARAVGDGISRGAEAVKDFFGGW